jgi:hypothetical protein
MYGSYKNYENYESVILLKTKPPLIFGNTRPPWGHLDLQICGRDIYIYLKALTKY